VIILLSVNGKNTRIDDQRYKFQKTQLSGEADYHSVALPYHVARNQGIIVLLFCMCQVCAKKKSPHEGIVPHETNLDNVRHVISI